MTASLKSPASVFRFLQPLVPLLGSQAGRLVFHGFAASSLGASEYGAFVLVTSFGTLLSPFVGLGQRRRVQLVYAKGEVSAARGFVMRSASVPAIFGVCVVAALYLFQGEVMLAAFVASCLAVTEMVSEALKAEERSSAALLWPVVSAMPAAFLALFFGLIDSSDGLLIVFAASGLLTSMVWLAISFGSNVRDGRGLLREGIRESPQLIATSLTQLGSAQVLVLLAGLVSTELVATISLASRIVAIVGTGSAAIAIPVVPKIAKEFWAGTDPMRRYKKFVFNSAPLVVIIALGLAAAVWFLPIERLEVPGLLLAVMLLLPGIIVAALVGPVTQVLLAFGETRPVIVATIAGTLAAVAGFFVLRFVGLSDLASIGLAGGARAAVQNVLQADAVRIAAVRKVECAA